MDNNSIIPETELQPEIEEAAAETDTAIAAENDVSEAAEAAEATDPANPAESADTSEEIDTDTVSEDIGTADPDETPDPQEEGNADCNELAKSLPAAPAAVEATAVPEEEAGAASPASSTSPAKKKKAAAIAQIAAAVAVALLLLGFLGFCLKAKGLYNEGSYAEAKKAFEVLDFLPQFADMPAECDYAQAGAYAGEGRYLEAHELYTTLADYKDSSQLADAAYYNYALSLYNAGKYKESGEAFSAIDDYADAAQKEDDALYAWAQELYEAGDYDSAQIIFLTIGSYEDAASRYIDCQLNMALALYSSGDYERAAERFERYTAESRTACAYLQLCRFQLVERSRVNLEDMLGMYEALAEYTDIEDIAQALKDPYFFPVRFFGAYWMSANTYFTIDADIDPLVIKPFLPWSKPDGAIWFRSDDKYCYFFAGDALWFVIVGFDGYDQLHPELMYMVGGNGACYDMYKYYDSATGETLTRFDVISASDVSATDVFWTEELQEQLLLDIFGIVLSPTDVSGADIAATELSAADVSAADAE